MSSTASRAQIKVKYLYGSICFDLHDLLSSKHVNLGEKYQDAIYAVDIAEKVSFSTPFHQDDLYIIREGRSLHSSDILFDKNCIEQLQSRCNHRMGGMSTPFILLKPSVSKLVPLVFQLPIVRDSENGRNNSDCNHDGINSNGRNNTSTKSYSKTLYFPANMKIFQLKRSLFTSKTTSVKPQSLKLIIGGRVAHDQTMIGDYFFKYSSIASHSSQRGPMALNAAAVESTDVVKNLNCNPLQVQLLQTFNLNHEVDVNIVLRDKQVLKFSTEISKPIIRIRQFLLQQLRIPLQIPLVIYLDLLGTKKSIELHPDYSLIDYGITSSDKVVNISLARLESNSSYTAPLPWDALTKCSEESNPETNVTNSLIESILGGGDVSNSDIGKLLTALSRNAGASDASSSLMSSLSALSATVEAPKKNCTSTPSASSVTISGGNRDSLNINRSSSINNSCSSLSSSSISNAPKTISIVKSKESGGFLSGFKKGFLLGGSGGSGSSKKVVATLQTPPKSNNKTLNEAAGVAAAAPSSASSPDSIAWDSKSVVLVSEDSSSCDCRLGKENINNANGENTIHTLTGMSQNVQLGEK